MVVKNKDLTASLLMKFKIKKSSALTAGERIIKDLF
jgi:hypothetical protein